MTLKDGLYNKMFSTLFEETDILMFVAVKIFLH